MVRQMMMMVCCVLTLGLLGPTDSAPQLAVTPDTIDVDLTRSLEVNCTFYYQNPSNISNLISLIVSKDDDHDNNTSIFQELASINQFSPNNVNIIRPGSASITGEIEAVGTSYLSLQWAYPSAVVAGLYRCSALGLDTSGHPVQEQQTKQVIASHPNTNQLIEMVKLQQMQMDNLMRDLAEIKMDLADVSTLKNDVSTLTNTLTTLNKTVSEETKDTDKYQNLFLTTLTHFYMKSSDYQGRHYLLSKEEQDTNRESQASCLLQGGYLAEINDVNEHSFIKSFLNSSAPQSKIWVMVGATQTEHPGTWVFSHSHQLMNYTEWAPSYPHDNSYTCLVLTKNFGWSMMNSVCSYARKYSTFLCEIPNL